METKLREINAQIEEAIENPRPESAVPAIEEIPKPRSSEDETAPLTNPRPDESSAKSTDQGLVKYNESEPLPEPDSYVEDKTEERLLDIPVSLVRPNPFQPRKELGEQEILELSESIKEFGVLQPILVRRVEEGYELIAGERRLRAATKAGFSKIPAVIVEAEPLHQQILALVENIQRKNLSSIEEAVSLQDILSKTGWSQSELSRRMGRSQASIANKLRLLRLDPDVQGLVLSGKLGERQARSLLSLQPEEQKLLAQKAVDEDLSARTLETLAENWNNKPRASRQKANKNSTGTGGELLGDVATLVNKHRGQGMMAQWKVKQMNQSSLVVEITVDLLKSASESEEAAE
jgi:ParB family chromosome partitioning protein